MPRGVQHVEYNMPRDVRGVLCATRRAVQSMPTCRSGRKWTHSWKADELAQHERGRHAYSETRCRQRAQAAMFALSICVEKYRDGCRAAQTSIRTCDLEDT
jgi:hypothetical protein